METTQIHSSDNSLSVQMLCIFVLEYSDLAYTSFNFRKEMKTKKLGLEVLCVIMTRMNIFSGKQKTILIIKTQNRINRYKLLYLPPFLLHSNSIMIKELY